ncbi:MAG TPA: DUF6371 domain-containing protein [Saprospiraceae bacterium]|nr:DUF6371 domain-containing protein [Saprospiraceae bacterium]
MLNFSCKLEPYNGMKTRFHCPSCEHRTKSFVRYINTQTGEHIHPLVGKCNRDLKCGYHYTPKQYFQENPQYHFEPKLIVRKRSFSSQKAWSCIPFESFNESLCDYEDNNFVQFLLNKYGNEVTTKAIENYYIGTSDHWKGSTIFWQIDQDGKIHTGKIMLYDQNTGKRVKKPYDHIYWTHKFLKLDNFSLKQCFFGEHLLSDKSKTVAIVESEKTAIIASLYFIDLIWLACGGISNLTPEKCEVLKGRNVVLFPDLKAFDKWSSQLKKIAHIANFRISNFLEAKASNTARTSGWDLADFLINFDLVDFQEKLSENKNVNKWQVLPKDFKGSENQIYIENNDSTIERGIDWDFEIGVISEKIRGKKFNLFNIELCKGQVIQDIDVFIDSHLKALKTAEKNCYLLPYLNRLNLIVKLLETNNLV